MTVDEISTLVGAMSGKATILRQATQPMSTSNSESGSHTSRASA